MDKTAVRIINVFDNVDEFIFALLMISLPFGWQFSIIPLILFAVLMLRKALAEKHKLTRERLFYFIPLFAYVLSLVVSLLYSSHPGTGADIVLRKSPLIFIPLLLMFTRFNSSTVRRGFRFFVLGTLLASLMYFVVGFYHSLKIGEGMLCIIPGFNGADGGILDTDIRNNYLMGEHFSFLMHPSYFGLLLAMSLVSVVFTLVYEENSSLIKSIAIPVFVVCGAALVLMSTNGSIITTIFIAIVLLVLSLKYRSILDLKSYWIILTGLVLIFSAVLHPQFKALSGQDSTSISMETRAQVSETVRQVVKENILWGVGIGDLKEAINEKYNELSYHQLANQNFGPHNEYMHTWAESGILSLLMLLWVLGTSLVYAYRRRSFFMLVATLIFGGNMFFESVLNRYWGILFFALFYTLLYFHSYRFSEELDDSSNS